MVKKDLLDMLRCPAALQQEGNEGRLELVHGCWLVSPESGYKYPIIDDIPVLLMDVGKKYKDVAVDALPVPPPDET